MTTTPGTPAPNLVPSLSAQPTPDSPEHRVSALEAKVSELSSTLAQTREALDSAERRHKIDLALVEADTLDLETARLLTELAVQQMDSADITLAISDLKRRKSFLFRAPGSPNPTPPPPPPPSGRSAIRPSGVMGAREPAPQPPSPLAGAATEALATGDRAALLRYLRARRAT